MVSRLKRFDRFENANVTHQNCRDSENSSDDENDVTRSFECFDHPIDSQLPTQRREQSDWHQNSCEIPQNHAKHRVREGSRSSGEKNQESSCGGGNLHNNILKFEFSTQQMNCVEQFPVSKSRMNQYESMWHTSGSTPISSITGPCTMPPPTPNMPGQTAAQQTQRQQSEERDLPV